MTQDNVFNLISKLIFLLLVVGSKYVDLGETDDGSFEDLRHDWNECCDKSVCHSFSCFVVIWSYSNWKSMRQKCQNLYLHWIDYVDMVRIQDEQDVEALWSILKEYEKPRWMWTGGSRCSKIEEGEIVPDTKWFGTDEPFPAWLSENFKDSKFRKKGCEYLAVRLTSNASDVEYDFQDLNAHHPGICEFTLPHPKITTEQDISSTKSDHLPASNISESEGKKTKEPTNSTSLPSEPMPSITPSYQTSETLPTAKYSTIKSASLGTAWRFCKSIKASGITWPDTSAGVTVRKECPRDLVGFAEWHCNEKTLTFQPKKPVLEGCKHKWIDQLENYVREKHDAVEISSKLAHETRQNHLSHGDILALVNLTSNLLSLYTEQKGEEEFEVAQNEEMPVYFNFSKTLIASISNMLRVEIKDAWEDLNSTRQMKEASTVLKLVTKIGSRLSCIKTSVDKLQFTITEENIDLQTFILNKTGKYDTLLFPQETDKVKADSFISLPTNLKLSKEFASCKTYSSAVGVIYKHLGDFLTHNINSSTEVVTKVLGFSLSNNTESIALAGGKVNITLKHVFSKELRNLTKNKLRCVFWNFSKNVFGAWDESGCNLIMFNETHTHCQCDHLTNFAVLMDIQDNINDSLVLSLMTYICCGFSSVALFLTLLCFMIIRSLHGRRSIITGNLCFTLLGTNVLVIFGLDQTANKVVCAAVAGVLHYWILSAFCWMLVEGYHLYRMVILVFQRGSILSVKYYYLFSYGLPLLIVGISAGLQSEGYGSEKYCWLSPNHGLIWSFVGPVCAILSVNIVIFVLTLRSASSVKIKREQSTIKKMKSWIRGSISVMCLLGLTWCIGLFYIDRKLYYFSYIFTLANGLQGAFIFLFHVILNEKVSSYYSCSLKGRRRGIRQFLRPSSSNPTNSKSSTKSSMNNSTECTFVTKGSDSYKKPYLSRFSNFKHIQNTKQRERF